VSELESYVSDAEWASWERARERGNAVYAAQKAREAARPVKPTYEDLLAQLHVLRHHNESLIAELGRLRRLAYGYVLGQIERLGDG
jgi:hypothetical protein